MTYIRYIPSPPLNAYLEDLYYLDGPAAYPRQKVLPVASSNLMINLGYPFDVYGPDQTEPFITCTDSWWVGVWNTYHSVDWPSNVQLFGVHFIPDGAYPFLQFPLSEMNSQVMSLDGIWGHCASEIRERLHAAPTIQAGFALLEQLLLVRLFEAPHGLDVVQFAIAEIAQYHGALSIRALSDQIGISQNGRWIVITDTDHYAPGKGDALWAWKSFLRGHHPILMDFGIIAGVNPPDPSAGSPGVPAYDAYGAARYAMGDTLRCAEKMNLVEMKPRGDLASTGFALANPNQEFLNLQPGNSAEPFTVTLEVGTYAVEWFNVDSRETKAADKVTVESDGNTSFTAPFAEAGPTVLYLKRVGR